jgi:ABC-type amino acid transport substrate-binding protein
VYSVKHKVAVRADDAVKVSTFDDIRKLPGADNGIITTQGTAYVAFLEQQGGLKVDASSKDNSANLQKLLLNRGRFFYQAESSLAEYIANDKLEGKFKILPAVFKEEGQHFVMAKGTPAATVEKLHAALEKLAKQGELAKIYAKYVP